MASGACGKWWMARTNLEKTLLSFSLILLFTCIIIILVGVVHHGKKPAEIIEDKVCSSNFCKERAGTMISMADFTVDPCEDFYEFSCGQYQQRHAVPTDSMEASVEEDAVNAVRLQVKDWLESNLGNNISVYLKAKTLFNSCMMADDEEIDPEELLVKAMDDQHLGRWVVLDDNWQGSYVELEQSLASFALLGIPLVFQLDVVPDESRPGKYITKLSPGKPLLNVSDMHILKNDMYYQFVETMLLLLGVSKALTHSNVNEILSTEAKMIRLKQNANKECGDPYSSDLQTIRADDSHDIQNKLYSSVIWGELMSNVLGVLNNNATRNLQFDLYCKRHIRDFNDHFYDSSDKSINIYFGWRFLTSVMEYLPSKFRQLQTYYKQFLFDADEQPPLQSPRWKECLGLVEEMLLPVIARAYTEQVLSDALLKEKMTIAESLRSNWENLLKSAKWLSAPEKELIKQKVKDSKFEVANSRTLPDVGNLEEIFADLSLKNDHLLHNILRYRRFKVLKKLRKLVSPLEPLLEWDYKSLTSTKELHNIENRIAVYFDKLRAPYLSVDQPRYLNYGAFGTFLSNQLNRYLVSLGVSPRNPNTTLWDLLLRTHEEESCSIVNWSTTEDVAISSQNWSELFGELSAVKTAHESYKAQEDDDHILPGFELTKEQLFFLSYAQTKCEVRQKHSGNSNTLPAKLRVNFALSNQDAFSHAFSCKKDSVMNPAKKCQVWNS